ncbi:MAG: hypothetical protein Q9164_002986 [Protoblastenia rupestris]
MAAAYYSDSPPEKTRKERLWLGYSADNLRSKVKRGIVEGSQSPGTSTRKGSHKGSSKNLSQPTPPLPIGDDGEKKKPHLEGSVDGTPSAAIELNGKHGPSSIPTRAAKTGTDLYTISYLIFFSIFGTLARLGVQALTFYPGAPVQTGVLWANVGGSLLMGFLSRDQKTLSEENGSPMDGKVNDEEQGKTDERKLSAEQQYSAVKKSMPLYIGLTTGFCGSFTSFSSFMRDAFYALANALPVPIAHPSATDPPSPISTTLNVPRNPGYSFMAVLAVLIITLGLSMGALQIGAHLALALESYVPSVQSLSARKSVDRSFVVLAFLSWLAALLMTILPPDRPGGPMGNTSWSQSTWRSKALFALVFAPLGCLLRFYVSLHLNGRIKSFPLGTFAVNIFGSVMEAMFIDLRRAPVGGMVDCQVLQGMSDGFCGCLTTVSTWVAEIKGLRRRHAYFYGAASMVVGLSSFIVITGSLMWAKGFNTALCTT